MVKLKRILGNGAVAAGGLLIAFLLLEFGARLLPPPYEATETAYLCSNELGWRGNPNLVESRNTDGYEHPVRYNQAGMHDTDHPLAKPEDTFRILMLGDSFTQATQVAEVETVHQVLEDLLNASPTPLLYEVINGAVTGWATGQELLYYRHEGRLYQPDLVILMVYPGNDVIGNLPGEGRTLNGRNCYAPYFVFCGDQFDPAPRLYAPGIAPDQGQCSPARKSLTTLLGKLYQHSWLYARLEPLFPRRRYSAEISYYPLYLPEKDPVFEEGWRVMVATILQLHQEVTTDGAELLVILISPADVIAYAGMAPEALEQLYQKVPELRIAQLDLPNQKLSESLSAQGIPVLNLQPLFIQHLKTTGENLHFPEDKHWNVKGHQFVAEVLLNEICCGEEDPSTSSQPAARP